MGYQVVWSPQAIDDMDAIAAYIARDSVSYAAAVAQRVIEVTRDLADNPFTGEIAQEFGNEAIRERFAYIYRVLYRIQGETVTVIAVIHGKRLLKIEMG
ncbi:MAG: type II toxin-antitoxin system RelE/ParE family toxin [Microcoleaceae cyanobacterium]